MNIVILTHNTANAESVKVCISNKQLKDIKKLQYSGGFKRFEFSIYDITPKRTDTTKQLSEFLKKAF